MDDYVTSGLVSVRHGGDGTPAGQIGLVSAMHGDDRPADYARLEMQHGDVIFMLATMAGIPEYREVFRALADAQDERGPDLDSIPAHDAYRAACDAAYRPEATTNRL